MAEGERAAFPQARIVALAECATHVIFDAVGGGYTTAGHTLARELVDQLQPGILLLADRRFCGFPLWARAAATGADLLWRAMSNMKPRHIETLSDGTWLAELSPAGNARRNSEPVTIRGIDYQLGDGRLNDTTYRLFTTLLDSVEAPAVDPAVADAQRWEIESTFDELKAHQRGARTVLRSKSPELVLQEIWGHLCCHYAIRTLMWEAADHSKSTLIGSASLPPYSSRSTPSQRRPIFPPRPEHGWRHAIRRTMSARQAQARGGTNTSNTRPPVEHAISRAAPAASTAASPAQRHQS